MATTHTYRPQSADTSIEADRHLFQLLAQRRVKFQRRQLINGVYLASPEDVILNKLRWRKDIQLEKQWRDVLGVLKVQGTNLDFDYLRQWANTLRLISDLNQAMSEAGLDR